MQEKNRTHGMMKQDKEGQLRSMLRVMCENKLAWLLAYVSVTQLPTAYWIIGPLKANSFFLGIHKGVSRVFTNWSVIGSHYLVPSLLSLLYPSSLSQLFFILSIYIHNGHLSMFFILEKLPQEVLHSIFSNSIEHLLCFLPCMRQ